MSDEREDLRPEDRQALEHLDALRAASMPRASDAARARARAAFVEGAVDRPSASVATPSRADAPSGPESTRPVPPRSVVPTPRGNPVAAIAVAACLLAMLGLSWYGATPERPWRVHGIDGPAQLRLDGRAIDLAVGDALFSGQCVVGDSTEIELVWGDLHLRLRPGTKLRLPAPPGRWFARKRTLELTAGEAYGSSGAGGPGFDLRLRTPEAHARLLGTTFAVFRLEDATCFCLYRGGLEVTPRGGEPFELPVERRVFVYDDGRPPSIEPLDAGERMKLRMVDDAATAP